MSVIRNEIQASKFPHKLGCHPDCPAGPQVLREIKRTVDDHPDNLQLAQNLGRKAVDYLTSEPCEFAKTGDCRLIELITGTVLAQRIIFEEAGFDIQELLTEENGREEI